MIPRRVSRGQRNPRRTSLARYSKRLVRAMSWLPSTEDRAPLGTMEKEFIQDQFSSWVGPFPFRTP